MITIKAIITTLDNLPTLKEQIQILRDDLLISEIIVVNNGSIDGTKEWLESQDGLTVINRENKGAGPGRNAGLNTAGKCDYFLMLDGGIRPLRGGTQHMLEYLERGYNPKIESTPDVIGVELVDFETDYEKAWRRWISPIEYTYRNTRLSYTAYCLASFRAFDGIRFKEDGPFGQAAWGVDDDELAYQWNEAGIVVHVISCQCNHGKSCTGVHPYRHASGSFRRLLQETGIWPNQYGSGYEQRLVWCQQNWPQYEAGMQWGEPWLTIVVKVSDIETTAKLIKKAHDELTKRRFKRPWHHWPNPYSVIAWGDDPEWLEWAEHRRLRQHHGNVIVINGEIIKRDASNEATWTGDFRLCLNGDWRGAVRPDAFYYGLVENGAQLDKLLEKYDRLHPWQPIKNPPKERGEIILT